MKLVCPHCAKVVEVAESQAGQQTKCEFCQGSFTVPLVPPDLLPPVPPAAPPPVEPAPVAKPEKAKFEETLPYPERPTDATVGASSGAKGAESFKAATAALRQKLSGVAQKLPGKVIFRFDPSWLMWVAPICLILLFVLLFFTWVGVDVGKASLISQSGVGVAFGSTSVEGVQGFNGTMTSATITVYFLLTLVGFLAAAALCFLRFAPLELQQKAQPYLEPVRTHRQWILLITAAGGFLCILLQTFLAFPLESDLTGGRAENVVASGLKANIKGDWTFNTGAADALIGDFIHRRLIWRWVQALSLIGAMAAALDFLLVRRNLQGTPTLEVGWGLEQPATPS